MEGRNWTFLLIAYFAGLAILIGGLASIGVKVNEETVLTGMAVVAGIFGLIWFIVQIVRHFIRKTGYNLKQFGAAMIGVDAEIVDSIPSSSSRALVPSSTTSVAVYEENEDEEDWNTFIEPDGLPLANEFQPSFGDFLGQMVAVFGIRRAGKSNCVSVIIETMAPHLLPMLICDTKDEYAGLVNPKYLPHGYMAGAPGATANVPDEVKVYYISLDEEGSFQFGQAIMEGTLQVVLNLKSYETDDEAARVMCGVIRGINAWQEARPNINRIPVEIILDEGHKWLPQNESNEISKDTQNLLHKTFFSTIVRLGGANGFGFIVASQRISELDKRCLQSSWKFLFKQTETIDIKKYEEYNLTREAILSLRPGECFVFSPKVLGFPMKMYRKKSPDLSMTPGIEQLARHRQIAHTKHDMLARRRSYTNTQAQTHETHVQIVPNTQTHWQTDANTQTQEVYQGAEALPPVAPAKQLTSEQEAVLEQWHRGKHTHREIATALRMSPNRVYNILIELDGRYIERNKKKVTA